VREALRNPIDVLNSLKSKTCEENYRFERLYRNLYNPEFFLLAYQNIYANEGNMTEGTDGKTIDGMGMNRINGLIEQMKNHSYQPNPARRIYIKKKNGKLRPLGIPSVDDKLVQEIVRMILESIYEDTFSKNSHGFRPERSCHTALKQIKCEFTAVKWFIEGDIKGFFDNINHQIMVALLRKRIKDEYFLALIWKFLKAGYLEDWVYNKTYSGTPQGSIISPLLSNIYLNEFDKYMESYKKDFDKGNGRTENPEYRHWEYKLKYIRHKKHPKTKWETLTAEEKKPVIKYAKGLKKQMHVLPYSDQMDEGYKRLVYVRYADDWLCGVIGSKEDAESIKADIKRYLYETLKLELSDEKTLITHSSNDKAKFLGYEIYTTKDESIKRHKNGKTRRTRMGRIQLYIPKEKWLDKLTEYGALQIKYDKNNGNREIYKPVHRNYLVNNDDLEILMQYNSEIRGMYNYYRIADNVSVLNDFFYVMKFSMFKTYGRKYQKRIGQIRKQFGYDKEFGVEYETKKGKQKMFFYNEGFKKENMQVIISASVDKVPSISRRYGRSGMIARLKANKCEYCGATDVPMEVHHVKKLKNLKGKKNWERHMIAMRRKTMVLCLGCHQKLHAGKLD
jgi:group II intron reverse transcriptase/maturase